jgi:hypothetical protein
VAVPAPARSGAVPAQVGLGDIKESWAVTLSEVRKSSMRVWGLLNPSRPLTFADERLEVEVQSPYHAEEMSVVANSALVADALHAALGIRPQLHFNARGAEAKAAPVEEDIGVAEGASPVSSDPVELVRKGLGAEVVEEKSNS